MGPERATRALRKALAMGADRAVLVCDASRRAPTRRHERRARGGARARRRRPRAVRPAGRDSDGAVLCAAVAERLQRPLVTQVAALELKDGAVRAKRQTETGYDLIEAPLPAVVAVSDAINEPRYPSLKGIMGAKSKPQETLTVVRPRLDAADVGEALAHRGARARRPAAARRHAASRTTAAAAAEIVDFLAERKPLVKTLVFLEHHDGAAPRARSACWRRRRRSATSAASSSAPACARRGGRGRRARRATVHVADDAGARRAAAAAARRRARRARPRRRLRHGAVSASPCSPPTSPPALAARLDAGLNWDLVDVRAGRRQLVGARPALGDSVYVDVGLALERRRRALPRRDLRPGRERRRRRRSRTSRPSSRTSRRARRCSSRRTRSRRGASIEDADIIVAGGRGLGEPENFAHSRSSRRRSAARSRRRAPSSTPAGTRTRRRSARRARRSRRSSTSPPASPAPSSTRSACRLGHDRRDQQGRQRADLRVRRPRRRRRPARDRSQAHGARPRAQGARAAVVRPADYPPPLTPAEAIAEPTDPPDERIEVGVLIVGAGPAGLACAIRLGQLARGVARARRAARRGADCGARQGHEAGRAPALRRRRQPDARCGACSRAGARPTDMPFFGRGARTSPSTS